MSIDKSFEKEMLAEAVYYEPKSSPWGKVQNYRLLTRGAFFVSTASHGGILIMADLADRLLSKEAQECGFMERPYLCFEEDCDAPVAIRELLDKGIIKAQVDDYYKKGEYEKAINDSLQVWHPEYWQAREQRLQKEQKAKQRKSMDREER